MAFVTNRSWIDGNADCGVRACSVEKFISILVLNPPLGSKTFTH